MTDISGQRAFLTLLFVDIVDSSELFLQYDDEDVGAIYKSFVKDAVAIVENNGGFVNQSMGDGLMAVFGLDKNHEKHALMACQTAAELHDAFYNIDLRIGIHTGNAVVEKKVLAAGPLLTIAGRAVNIAAKLEKMAQKGGTILSQETLDIVESQVNATPSAVLHLSNEVVQAHHFVSWRAPDERVAKSVIFQFNSFVGRDFELAALKRQWHSTDGQRPHVHVIAGAAGIGKSRLIDEFKECIRDDVPVLHYNFLPSGSARSNFFKSLFQQISALPGGQAIQEKLDLTNSLMLRAFEELKGADVADAAWRDLDQNTKANFKAALLWRALEAQSGTVIIILEDIHWADQEVRFFINARRGREKIFVLLSTRDPHAFPDFDGQKFFARTLLNNLSAETGRALLDAWLGNSVTLTTLKNDILDAADGNPFFLHEMVATLLSSGQLTGRIGNFFCLDKSAGFAVPTSVKSLVLLRIQALSDEVQDCLKAMAVLGLRIDKAILRTIVNLPDAVLEGHLTTLKNHGLLRQENNIFENHYYFAHALIQDSIYETILKAPRRDLHRKIFNALKLTLRGPRLKNITLLAHHSFHAQFYDQAFSYNYFAGEQALSESNGIAAIEYYRQACYALENLPPEFKNKMRYLVKCKLGLATALSIQNHHAVAREMMDEVGQQLPTANDSEHSLENKLRSLELFDCWAQGALIEGVELGYSFIDKLDLYSDPYNYVTIAHRLGGMLQDQGRYADSNKVLLTLEDFSKASDQNRYGLLFPPAAVCFAVISRNFGELGDFAQAKHFSEISLSFLESNKNILTRIYALSYVATYLVREEKYANALPFFQEAYELTAYNKTNLLHPFAAVHYGLCFFNVGKTMEGMKIVEEGWRIVQQQNIHGRKSLYAQILAEMKLLNQDYRLAKDSALMAISIANKYSQNAHMARAYYIAGLAEHHMPNGNTAEAHSLLQTAKQMALSLHLNPLVASCDKALQTELIS